MKVSIASPAECGELAVRTLDVDEAADLFSAEGLTASLRRAASFLCPASPRQLIDAVLDAVRPLHPGGDLPREDLADLLDLLVSGGDLLELRQSGDAPGRLLYLGPPSYVERRPGPVPAARHPPLRRAAHQLSLAGAIQYEGHTRTIELSPDRAAAQLSELGLHMIRREAVGTPASGDATGRTDQADAGAAVRRRTGRAGRGADGHRPRQRRSPTTGAAGGPLGLPTPGCSSRGDRRPTGPTCGA